MSAPATPTPTEPAADPATGPPATATDPTGRAGPARRGRPPGEPEPGPPAVAVGSRLWVPLLGLGVAAILYGLMVMSLRPVALASIAIFAGLSFVIGGVANYLLAGGLDGGWRFLAYAGAVLGVVAGVAAFFWPGMTILVLAVFTAWSLAISGVLRLVGAFAGPRRELWWLGVVLAIVELGLGLWALGSPERQVLLFVNLVGLWLVVVGVDCIVAAFTSRSRT